MKHTKKIEIPLVTWSMILLSCFMGLFKQILCISMIIVFHEIGHIFVLHQYGYMINNVIFYPFGGLTKVEKDINTPLKIERKIACAGIFNQIILFLLAFLFYKIGWIHETTHYLFQKYNIAIAAFNLLPMIPLDGNIILTSFLEKRWSYKRAYQIKCIVSFICILLFVCWNHIFSLNNYLIAILLGYKTFLAWKNHKYYYNQFLLERYLNIYPYEKIKREQDKSLLHLKKDTLHFFKEEDHYVHEKKLLEERFDRSAHF